MLGNFVFAYEPEKVSDYKTKEYLFNPNTLKYTIDINIDKNTKKE